MSSEQTCPHCGEPIESTDDVELVEDVQEVTVEGTKINPYRDRKQDLFLCKGCKRPYGVVRRKP